MSEATKSERIGLRSLLPVLLLSAVVLLIELAVSAWAWVRIPEGARVPTHWGINGQADGWSSKEWALGFGPVLTVAMVLLLVVMPRFEPRRGNLALSAKSYVLVVAALLAMFGTIHVAAVLAAAGFAVAMDRVVLLGIGALFMVIGLAIRDIKSNFLFGIRTPWTMSSDLSWRLTHRVSAWLWAGHGLLIFTLAAIGAPRPVLFATLLGGVVVLLGVAFGYSYVVWRRDPNRSVA